MKKTILVPTDFSKNALAAAQYAIQLSDKMGCDVHLLHAYMAFYSAFQSKLANQTNDQRAILEAKKGMQGFLQSLAPLSKPSRVSTSEVKAGLVDAITDFAEDNHPALMVMGTHGASGLKMGLLGSNTYDIAKTAVAPLLVIPPTPLYDNNLGNVIFFTDYQEADKKTWKGMISLFGNMVKQCTLVHIHEGNEPPTAADRDRLDRWRGELESTVGFSGLASELIYGKESIDIVNDAIVRFQASLTVLTLVGGRGFFEKLTHKSLAKAIIHQPKTPVLLIDTD